MSSQLNLDRKQSWQLIKRLMFENAHLYLRRYVVILICMVLVAATTAASAWIMKDVINEIFIARDQAMMQMIALAIVIIFLIKGLASYVQISLLAQIGNNMIARYQSRVFSHLMQQPLAFFERHSGGELIARITHNISAAKMVLEILITRFGRDLLTLSGLIIVMIIQDPVLAFLALVGMPIAILVLTRLVKRVRVFAKQEFHFLTSIVSSMQETFAGIRIIKSFNLQTMMTDQMDETVIELEKQANKIARINAGTSPLMETLGGFSIAGIIFYGGYSVIHLDSDPGKFFSFITALLLAYEPAKRLARMNIQLEQHLIGVQLLYDLLDQAPRLTDIPNAKPILVTKGDIELKDVTFSYEDQPTLNHVSIRAESGQVTALVGPSGAGKTTVFSLLQRFYHPEKGEILIDGQDIEQHTARSIRENIAYVGQDSFLFNTSIFENIAMGALNATETEVIEAARQANSYEFIMEQEAGFNTHVGERGEKLSGGQRQRITIARALLSKAPILLLDEATAALDTHSEKKIHDALETLIKGRTTLVIAHRLSTIRNADKIIVLDKGQVIEQGSHDDLVNANGLYAKLHDLQFSSD